IGAEGPEEIAVSILAQLIRQMRTKDKVHLDS
ncbi:MAG: XdhC family protein, partial [Thermodesulfatator sp.]